MDQWVEEELSSSELEEATGRTAVFDERMLREPIRVLEPRPPLAVSPDTSIADVVRLMREHRVGCVLVVADDILTGILTERDLLLKLDVPPDGSRTAAALMTPAPEALAADDPIAWALNKMSVGGFRHVPLVDHRGRPVGVVSVKDIVDYLVDCFPNEVLTVAPDPARAAAWRGRDGG